MLIELNYVFFSVLLVIYGAWRYFKRKEKHLLYPTISFTFLALSATFQLLNSPKLMVYLPFNTPVSKLLQLSGLALFACFTISTLIALRKIIHAIPHTA